VASVVSRPFPSWNRCILTEIYLCHACSCQEILRAETAGQAAGDDHSCCVTAGGGLWTWGGADGGILGHQWTVDEQVLLFHDQNWIGD
jgi:hypothetical protein